MARENPLPFPDPIPDATVRCNEARDRDDAKEGPLVVPKVQIDA